MNKKTIWYHGKILYEVSPGIWRIIEDVSFLDRTIEFIEGYLNCNSNTIDNIEKYALDIINIMDGIKYD